MLYTNTKTNNCFNTTNNCGGFFGGRIKTTS